MYIDMFKPAEFKRRRLDLERLNGVTGKKFRYASKGHHAIEHILRSLDYQGKILLSPYMCPTVLIPLHKLKIPYDFFDIDEGDLNPNLDSIKEVLKKTGARAVIAASLYGNPANMTEISNYCHQEGVLLIDDGAQSFGTRLDGKYVGTFGNGGFFSFARGKATAAHMGSLFWTENEAYDFERTQHRFIHYLRYLDWYLNRYKIYENRYQMITSKLNTLSRALATRIDIANDDICNFEKEILGGILEEALNDGFQFRQKYFRMFVEKFDACEEFSIVKALRGEPRNHKLVILCKNEVIRDDMAQFLKNNSIYSYEGYTLLTDDMSNIGVGQKISRRVIEMPIEDDEAKMQYLFDTLEKYLGR